MIELLLVLYLEIFFPDTKIYQSIEPLICYIQIMSKALANSLSLLKEIKAQLTTESDAPLPIPSDPRTYGSIKRANNQQSQWKKFEEDISNLMTRIDNIFEEAHER